MEQSEITSIYGQMREHSIWYRGRIIDEVIWLEFFIDLVISDYFCPDTNKRDDFVNIVLSEENFAFGTKEKIFQSILLKDKFKDFYSNNTNLMEDIIKSRKMRNSFAHCKIDTSSAVIEKYDNENLYLLIWKNGIESPRNFKRSELDSLIKSIQTTMDKVKEFLGLVKSN